LKLYKIFLIKLIFIFILYSFSNIILDEIIIDTELIIIFRMDTWKLWNWWTCIGIYSRINTTKFIKLSGLDSNNFIEEHWLEDFFYVQTEIFCLGFFYVGGCNAV
jgi:hypothetical protein